MENKNKVYHVGMNIPFQKSVAGFHHGHFPRKSAWSALQGTPPSCSSIMQNDTQCGADSWKDLVSLDHSTFLLQSSELTISTEEHLNFLFCWDNLKPGLPN